MDPPDERIHGGGQPAPPLPGGSGPRPDPAHNALVLDHWGPSELHSATKGLVLARAPSCPPPRYGSALIWPIFF